CPGGAPIEWTLVVDDDRRHAGRGARFDEIVKNAIDALAHAHGSLSLSEDCLAAPPPNRSSALRRRSRARVIFAKMGELARNIFDLLAARHEREDLDTALLPAPKASGDPSLDQHEKIVARRHRVMRVVGDEDDAHT